MLDRKSIGELFQIGVDTGLTGRRSLLLAWLPAGLVGSLPQESTPADQLRVDLLSLNAHPPLSDGTVPIRVWIENAINLISYRPEAKKLKALLVRLDTPAVAAGGVEDDPPEPEPVTPPKPVTPREPVFPHTVPLVMSDQRNKALLKILSQAYPTPDKIALVLSMAGQAEGTVPLAGSARVIWSRAMSALAKSGKLQALVDEVLEDEEVAFFHPKVRALLT